MTDTSTHTGPTPADDAATVARLSALSKEQLREFAEMRIYFRDDAPVEVRQAFHASQRLIRELLGDCSHRREQEELDDDDAPPRF